MAKKRRKKRIEKFDFPVGTDLSNKFEVVKKLGEGWEGEVYTIREKLTGIERAAKFFYPARNIKNKSILYYAQKLHKLRHCSILIQYSTQDVIYFEDEEIHYLVSEFVEGLPLNEFLKRQKGGRIPAFQALHLLHALADGLQAIHRSKEYHGDLHTGNVIVSRYGLGFELKLIDFYHWGKYSKANMEEDLFNSIRVFYDCIGGKKYYNQQHPEVKKLICGLNRTLMLKKFKNVGQLKGYIENMVWE